MSSIDARLSLRTGALLAVFALHGCAGMGDVECRGANWYDVGYRDARYKLSQVEIYAAQCARRRADRCSALRPGPAPRPLRLP